MELTTVAAGRLTQRERPRVWNHCIKLWYSRTCLLYFEKQAVTTKWKTLLADHVHKWCLNSVTNIREYQCLTR